MRLKVQMADYTGEPITVEWGMRRYGLCDPYEVSYDCFGFVEDIDMIAKKMVVNSWPRTHVGKAYVPLWQWVMVVETSGLTGTDVLTEYLRCSRCGHIVSALEINDEGGYRRPCPSCRADHRVTVTLPAKQEESDE